MEDAEVGSGHPLPKPDDELVFIDRKVEALPLGQI